jgi:tRNA nucleotidyltransferase (CCA-adding enzyme)
MPDYMYLLESRLSAEQRAALVRIQESAAAHENNLYLVGGAVRDMISGMPIRDLDFVVEGNPSRIVRDLQNEGATIISENDAQRQVELALAGDVDVSIAAAREDVYSRPGAKPEIRFSTIMEDLKRRDFSINAIAVSLNANSRGLLLDPTNGLADLERKEIRALSIHSFTNQPVRLLRALRYAARMGFKLDTRTSEWFDLAMERNLQTTISADDSGSELRQIAREEKPAATLKAWESKDLFGGLHPQLSKKHPDYEAINRIAKVRDELWSAGFRPRLLAPMTLAIFGKLKPNERNSVLQRMALGSAELRAIHDLEAEAGKAVKHLSGPKTASPREAFAYLEKTPLDVVSYILAESSNSKAVSQIRNYLNKWKPLQLALPAVATELESLGQEHGPKFDKVLEDFFQAQLTGRARKPEEHINLLRKLAGIKEPPKKVEEKKKNDKPKKKNSAPEAPVPAAKGPAKAAAPHAPSKAGAPAGKPNREKSAPRGARPREKASAKIPSKTRRLSGSKK